MNPLKEKSKTVYLQIPVNVIEEDGSFFMFPDKETEDKLGSHHMGIHGEGKTIEEAESKFWMLFKLMQDLTWREHMELDLWKPFRKGPWKVSGGRWFSVYGIHVYFRFSKPQTRKFMVGGWFVPFTNLNIRISNLWIQRRKFLTKG